MKHYFSSILLIMVVLLGSIQVLAQDVSSGAQTAEKLRVQLSELQMREAELQSRLTELDYQLKPENIERYFAGVGSTRPEELREQRRKQLQIEKNAVVTQLQSIADSKLRLETAITRADALAYQQSALGSASLMVRQVWSGHRGLVVTGVILLGAMVGLFAVAIMLRKKSPAK